MKKIIIFVLFLNILIIPVKSDSESAQMINLSCINYLYPDTNCSYYKSHGYFWQKSSLSTNLTRGQSVLLSFDDEYINRMEYGNLTLVLNVTNYDGASGRILQIYNISEYDENNVTWNTRPELNELIKNISMNGNGYYFINIHPKSKYIQLINYPINYFGVYQGFSFYIDNSTDVPRYNYIIPSPPPPNLEFYVYYNNSNYEDNPEFPLDNTYIYINSSENCTTDEFGGCTTVFYNYSDKEINLSRIGYKNINTTFSSDIDHFSFDFEMFYNYSIGIYTLNNSDIPINGVLVQSFDDSCITEIDGNCELNLTRTNDQPISASKNGYDTNNSFYNIVDNNSIYIYLNEPGIDTDMDGIPDDIDNCPNIYNPEQEDIDNDGVGDVCDSDGDNGGYDNSGDSAKIKSGEYFWNFFLLWLFTIIIMFFKSFGDNK